MILRYLIISVDKKQRRTQTDALRAGVFFIKTKANKSCWLVFQYVWEGREDPPERRPPHTHSCLLPEVRYFLWRIDLHRLPPSTWSFGYPGPWSATVCTPRL